MTFDEKIVQYFVFQYDTLTNAYKADVVPKEKHDRLLENATILADEVRKYEKMFEAIREVEKMKKFLIIIEVVVLIFVIVCITWSAISLERIDSQLEHWDRVIMEAEK